MRIHFSICFLFQIIFSWAAANDLSRKTDSLYIVLDSTVARLPRIIELKEQRINYLCTELVAAANDQERYRINSLLYLECCKYNYDKAMMFLNNNLQLADKNKNLPWKNESLLRQAKLLLSTIAFQEASNILKSIDTAELTPYLKRSYYSIKQLYIFYLMQFSDKYYLNKYKEEYNLNNQRIISLHQTQDDLRQEYEFNYSFCRAQPTEKQQLTAYLNLISTLRPDNPYYGATAASIADLYRMMNHTDTRIFYLVKAAISDLSIATKEHSALQELALYLCEKGDITRAYKYIDISMQDAITFNARHRIMDASPKFMFIQAAYKQKEDTARQTLRMILIISLLIIVITISFIVYVRRQSKKLLNAYKNLNEIHTKYKSAMVRLQQMSRSKDNYLVQILTLSSTFFKKQSDFKKSLYKRILSGKTEDIYKTLKLSIHDNQDLETFFKLFDQAVCDLFPGFIEKVNQLLQPDKRIELKTEKELSAEMRILALIRLGITDTSLMSDFLNYSMGTIYTYRSKLRNHALHPSTFELEVAHIDKIELE